MKRKINKVDETYFDRKTIQSCYWAGFIAADGYICKNHIGIKLSNKDRDHLTRYSKDIKFTGRLYESEGKGGFKNSKIYKSVLLKYTSRCHIQSLNQLYNIRPRKTQSLMYPTDFKSEKHELAFILGYFDGDGTVYKKKNTNRLRYHIKILGNEQFLRSVRGRLSVLLSIRKPGTVYKKIDGNIFVYEFNTKETIKFLDGMKELRIYRLKRKFKHPI